MSASITAQDSLPTARLRCVALFGVAAIVAGCFQSAGVFAQATGGASPAEAGKKWALLVGIEKYQKANPLRYTINDVRRLSDTLRVRGGYPRDGILEITDAAPDVQHQPLKASLMAELPAWLKKPGPQDTIVVYFSGHGFRDADGKMYLAPIDCDPANPAATGIPVTWFREQIAACKAGFISTGSPDSNIAE